jgi:hypothetical protein
MGESSHRILPWPLCVTAIRHTGMSAPTEYELKLRCTPGHPWTGEQRLKRLLKFALRSLGLQCISVREAKPDASASVCKSDGQAE